MTGSLTDLFNSEDMQIWKELIAWCKKVMRFFGITKKEQAQSRDILEEVDG